MLRLIGNEELDRDEEAEAYSPSPVMGALASEIRAQFQINKDARRDTDDEMLACLRARSGEYDPEVEADIKQIGGSSIYLNVSATIARTASSWIEDIMRPAGDKAWGIEASPVPELSPEIQGLIEQAAQFEEQRAQQQFDGRQYKKKQTEKIKRLLKQQADERAEKMSDLVEDQFDSSDFGPALAQCIDDFVTFPNCFMRTCYRNRRKLSWGPNAEPIVEMVVQEEDERVSPFDVYPSPDQTHINDGKLVVRDRFTRGQLYAMIGQEGYDDDAIRDILTQYSTGGLREHDTTDSERFQLENRDDAYHGDDGLIDGLLYYGAAQGLHLLQWGVPSEQIEDPLKEYQIEAILIGDKIIKATVNVELLERRDYYTASYQNIPGSFWGASPLQLSRSAASLCNSLARAIANNAGLTGGPQVAVDKDALPEGETVTALHAMKIWQLETDPASGQTKLPIEFYQPQIVINELQHAYEYFESKAADAAGVPKYTWGDASVKGAGETAQGLAMLLEGASKSIKAAVRHIDEGVVKPRVERQYHENMLYHDDPEVKGDLQVIARGSSVLIAKNATQQRRNEALGMTNNETDMTIIGIDGRAELLREHFRDLDMAEIVPDKEDIEERIAQMQQGGQDPRIEAANIQAQTRLKEKEMDLQDNEKDRQLKMVLDDKQTAAAYQKLVEEAKAKAGAEVLHSRARREEMALNARYDAMKGVQV